MILYFGITVALLVSVTSAYGPKSGCGLTEAEGWVTEPWTFGEAASCTLSDEQR